MCVFCRRTMLRMSCCGPRDNRFTTDGSSGVSSHGRLAAAVATRIERKPVACIRLSSIVYHHRTSDMCFTSIRMHSVHCQMDLKTFAPELRPMHKCPWQAGPHAQ